MVADWSDLARKFSAIQADMIHREQSELRGDQFWAEALRRLLGGYEPRAAEPEPAERLHAGCWAALASSERTLREQYDKFTTALGDARGTCASAIRARCNEVAVPSKYRREGVLLAAEWLDPGGAESAAGRKVTP